VRCTGCNATPSRDTGVPNTLNSFLNKLDTTLILQIVLSSYHINKETLFNRTFLANDEHAR
jgi:hypothetical protein